MLRRIERVGPPSRHSRRRHHRSGRLDGSAWQAGLCRRACGAPHLDVVLEPLDRRLELLIAILQLLHSTGELAHLVFELIDLDVEIAAGHLGARRRHGGHASDGADGSCETDHHCSLHPAAKGTRSRLAEAASKL
jgi:hypothetical protein